MPKQSSFIAAVNGATRLKPKQVRNPKKDVGSLIETRKLSIGQVMALRELAKPAPSQRQHEWRWLKGKARYLHRFALPQACIVVGVLNGEFYIVDGNTRLFGWASTESLVVPDQMLVVFYDIESLEAMRKVYDAVDSAGSKKTVRNEVISSLRESSVDIEKEVQSDFVLSGSLKGILAALLGSGSMAALKRGLSYYSDEILMLDKLKLREKPVKHSAVLAAGLKLYKDGYSPALVSAYIMQFVYLREKATGNLLKSTTAIELSADKAFLEMASVTKSTSSANAIRAMLPVYLDCFRAKFCRELASSSAAGKLGKLAAAALKKAA